MLSLNLNNGGLNMFKFIYDICKTTGWAFGFGAFEGAIIYFGIIISGYLMVVNKKDNNSISMAKEK